ncbi:hypothetical protein CcCBS67573_g00936 [Chytriomyces confervae]|uniref:Uncharacterized protein n=1 Tax=Chytriomyces confervae TaxID=246404 RepID=A0A507FN95_9FUNG|nr:hypothetical protein HDU80_005813 [Chytriomyces hyalinus]TPX77774.1 hypothetical protein CcCBS67573_g00936 [Chytriomyces confervae]
MNHPQHLTLLISPDSGQVLVGYGLTATGATLSTAQHAHNSYLVLKRVFASNKSISYERLAYATAGVLFRASSPFPFGGSRTKPGFVQFEGRDAQAVLRFIVRQSLETAWRYKGNGAVDSVAGAANCVVALQASGRDGKDKLDDLVMKGLQKCGHIAWRGEWVIPPELRDSVSLDAPLSLSLSLYVLFTARRTLLRQIMQAKADNSLAQ